MPEEHVNAVLDDYIDDQLSAEERRDVELHLDGCADCRIELELAKKVRTVLSEMPVAGPSAEFFDQAMQEAKQERMDPVQEKSARSWVPAALAASLVLMLVGGLLLRAPDTGVGENESLPATASVTMALEEPQTINLVFNSASAVEDVVLIVDLPMGVELAAYPGRMQIRWATSLQAGKNRLPLDLVAIDGMGGELVATVQSEGTEKVFRIDVEVMDG